MVLLARRMIFNSKPFSGRGASLYASVGSGSGIDPGPESIQFRKLRFLGSGRHLQGTGFTLGNGLIKTTRIAHLEDPDTEFNYEFPAEWHDRIVWLQVRTHWDDVENTSNADPYRLDLTAGGEEDLTIHGTGSIASLEKRDGGVYRLRVDYLAANHGTQPTSIIIRKSSGPGTIADVAVDYISNALSFTLDTVALTDSTSYTFQAIAKNGSSELILDSITFTADAAGPPAVTSLSLSAI